MDIQQAYNLCLLKWNAIVKANGRLTVSEQISELKSLTAECAYCELYNNKANWKMVLPGYTNSDWKEKRCIGCPLHEGGFGCLEDNSVYELLEEYNNVRTWTDKKFGKEGKSLAQQILDAIIRTKPDGVEQPKAEENS